VVGHGARELDVLTLIGRGRSNTEIARELCISEGTVKSHVGHIFDKLGLRDRAAAIVYAFDHNIALPATTPPNNAGTPLSQGVAKGI
jgi:DNA-binding NarL/FixJ family response regulator